NQQQTLGAVLYRAAESLRWLSVLLYPVMPEASRAIWQQLGLDGGPDKIDPTTLKWGEVREARRIGELQALLPRPNKAAILAEINKTPASEPIETPPSLSAATDAEEPTSFIEIDDFAKVDLRVGQVL